MNNPNLNSSLIFNNFISVYLYKFGSAVLLITAIFVIQPLSSQTILKNVKIFQNDSRSSLNQFDKNYGNYFFQDSTQKHLVRKKSISAVFIGFGGGLGIPVSKFSETGNPAFGLLGRLEFSSTGIFPFVIGGEVNYYSYNSPDEFRTVNLLSSFRTKILSVGLNIDYSLSKLFRSSFTMPFLSIDVKSNTIKRNFDENRSFEGLPLNESKISVGAGAGFTLFILDFTVKYNYMKDNSFVSVTTKTKFPVIRF